MTKQLSKGARFKIVSRYVYPEVESAKTFRTRAEAQAELRRWKKDALAQHQEIFGRVVETKESE